MRERRVVHGLTDDLVYSRHFGHAVLTDGLSRSNCGSLASMCSTASVQLNLLPANAKSPATRTSTAGQTATKGRGGFRGEALSMLFTEAFPGKPPVGCQAVVHGR